MGVQGRPLEMAIILNILYYRVNTLPTNIECSRTRALVSTGATGAIAPELFEGHNVKNIFLGNFLRKLLVKNFLAPELLES